MRVAKKLEYGCRMVPIKIKNGATNHLGPSQKLYAVRVTVVMDRGYQT